MSEEEVIDEEKAESEYYDTLEQERILLKYLFSQILTARKFFNKTKEDIFTSPIRVWLFRIAKEIFKETNALLDEATLKSELARIKKISCDFIIDRKRITRDIDHVKALTEWNFITASELKHNPEWLISDLERKKRAKEFLASTEKAIEKLYKGNSDEAMNDLNSDLIQIRSGVFTEKPLRRLSDPTWQIEIIKNKKEHPEQYASIKTGFSIFDSRVGAFRGELILLTAHTGVGKSTMMRSMAFGASQNGFNVLYIVNEEIDEQTGNKFSSMCGEGLFYRDLKTANLTDDQINKLEQNLIEFGKNSGEIFIQELPQFHTCAEIEQILVDLEQQGIRIDIVFLDYLDHLKPSEKSWSETDEQSKAVAEFKSVCMKFRICGVTATQADTASADSTEMSSYNVRGSKQKAGAANVVAAIKEMCSEDSKDAREDRISETMTWKIMITKNRDGGKFSFFARFHKTTGQVREFNKETADRSEIEAVERDIMAAKEAESKKGKGKRSFGKIKGDGTELKELPRKPKEESEDIALPPIEDEKVVEMAHDLDDVDEDALSKSAFSEKPKKIIRKAASL